MKRPLIIAHRGASEYAQENTPEAVLLAVEQGADMVEIDIRVTKDQILVINHDEHLKRFRPGIRVRDHSYQELKELGYELPKLKDVIKKIPDHILLNLDLKNPSMDLSLKELFKDPDLEKRVYFDSNNVWQLERYGWFFPRSKTILNSHVGFDPLNFSHTRIGEFVSFVALPMLLFFFLRFIFMRRMKHFFPTHVSLVPRMCTQGNVDFFHSLDVKVFVSPVNKEKNMEKFIKMGVDGIKTDRPDVLFSLLHPRETA